MKRTTFLTALLAMLMGVCHTSCAQKATSNDVKGMKGKKTLVAFFSRADENYNVGYIAKGNTQRMAEVITATVGADTFHIETVSPYPKAYKPCIEQAKQEKEQGARPAIKGDAAVEDYEVVFIGYPNWWGEPPMALYTFLERHQWQGKTIIPFVTHEGSGFGGTDRCVATACKGAKALKGLAIDGTSAQSMSPKTRQTILSWLQGLGY